MSPAKYSGNITRNMVVLAKIPGTDKAAGLAGESSLPYKVTAAYYHQISDSSEILSVLGNPSTIVDSILMPDIRQSVGNAAAEAITHDSASLDSKLMAYSPEVVALATAGTVQSRLKPIMDYIQSSGRSATEVWKLSQKLSRNEALTQKDLMGIVSQLYSMIKATGSTPKEVEYRIPDYLLKGDTTPSVIDALNRAVPAFKEASEYKALLSQKAELSKQKAAMADMHQLRNKLIYVVGNIAKGSTKEVVEVGSVKLDVYKKLQDIAGENPVKPRLVSKEGQGKVFSPIKFAPSIGISGLPKELGEAYHPVQEISQVVTLFDSVIRKILVVYSLKTDEIRQVDERGQSLILQGLSGGMFMPFLFPKDHVPTSILHNLNNIPDDRKSDASAMIFALINNKQGIAQAVADDFKVPAEQIKLEELITLQAQLMDLLPVQFFQAWSIYRHFFNIFNKPISEYNLHMLNEPGRIRLNRYNAYEKELKDGFNVGLETMFAAGKKTYGLVDDIFGQGFNFVKDVTDAEVQTTKGVIA
jgi:hypothetical protein